LSYSLRERDSGALITVKKIKGETTRVMIAASIVAWSRAIS